MKTIIGIDFSTSSTVCCYKFENDQSLHFVFDQWGNNSLNYMPSAIFAFNNSNVQHYGVQALADNNNNEDGVLITNFKLMLLERDDEIRRQGENYIKLFLRELFNKFRMQTMNGGITEKVVRLSYPAKWTDSMILFMKQAVCEAGFCDLPDEVEAVKEPVAALADIQNSELDNKDLLEHLRSGSLMKVLMIDMGAGTSDICILPARMVNGIIQPEGAEKSYPSVDNPILCGGREIDAILQNHIVNYVFNHEIMTPLTKQTNGTALLSLNQIRGWFELQEAKTWKEDVSNRYNENLNVAFPQQIKKGLSYLPISNKECIWNDFYLDKKVFYQITKEHWVKLSKLIDEALEYANISSDDIDLAFATGGHSQWFTVNDMLRSKFPKLAHDPWRLVPIDNPSYSVARGLCNIGDLKPKYTTVNNVWVKIKIAEYDEEPELIVKAGEDVGEKHTIVRDVILERNLIFGQHNFPIEIDFYEGSSLKTARKKQIVTNSDNNSFLGRLLSVILFIPIFFDADFLFHFEMNLTMKEDGTIDLNGHVIVDNRDYTKKEFTYSDFIEV